MTQIASIRSTETIAPESRIGRVLEQHQLKVSSLIGTGNYGQIYLGESLDGRKKYAMKCLPRVGLSKQEAFWQWNEIHLMQELQGHSNMIKFYGVVEDKDALWVIMEKARMDLYDALKKINESVPEGSKPRGFQPAVVREIFSEVCSSIQYCHDKNIAHRDIKLENVLVGEDFRVRFVPFIASHQIA